jgi:hypothetical protein
MNSISSKSQNFPTPYMLRLVRFCFAILAPILCGELQAEITEKVAEKIQKSTVRVVILAGEEVKGHGSGFIISNQGHIVTNRHVIADAEQAVVLYCDGDRVFLRRADLVGFSSTADLAILKIEPIPTTLVTQIATTDLVAGQAVMTVGFPGAIDTGSWATLEGVELGGKSGEGIITSPEARGDFVASVFPGAVAKCMIDTGISMILHSAKISGGNSGGPLIDVEGRVCGINTALVPASMAGADYPISIHSSELVNLAREHSIKLNVSNAKASQGGASFLNTLLLIALVAFAIVIFLIVIRKPRAVMVNVVSKLIHRRNPANLRPQASGKSISPQSLERIANGHYDKGLMLRGRDLQGRSFEMNFRESDFKKSGCKLVIGRNSDLSQLHLPHDSVSRQHATLSYQGGNFFVEDRNSGNGTRVNGRVLPMGSVPMPLHYGDKLTLGEVDLIFEVTR